MRAIETTYRIEGRCRYKPMTLAAGEFIRRFLMHVLPHGFHRIRHYGFLAKASCTHNIAHARKLLPDQEPRAERPAPDRPEPSNRCPHCGGHMIIIETFARGSTPRHQPTRAMSAISIDTS